MHLVSCHIVAKIINTCNTKVSYIYSAHACLVLLYMSYKLNAQTKSMSCRKRTKNDLSDAPCPNVAAIADNTMLSELTPLTFAMRHIPDRTPKRWDLVNTFISDGNTDKCSPQIRLPHGNTLIKKSRITRHYGHTLINVGQTS